jgi:hypothetical protein
MRSTSCVMDPALLFVPSTFCTGIGLSSLTIDKPCLATNRGLRNRPVAPGSNSTFTSNFFCVSRVSNLISIVISPLMFMVLKKNFSVSSWFTAGRLRMTIFLFWQGNEAVLNHAPVLPQVALLESTPNGVEPTSSGLSSLSTSKTAYLLRESSRGVTGPRRLLTPQFSLYFLRPSLLSNGLVVDLRTFPLDQLLCSYSPTVCVLLCCICNILAAASILDLLAWHLDQVEVWLYLVQEWVGPQPDAPVG